MDEISQRATHEYENAVQNLPSPFVTQSSVGDLESFCAHHQIKFIDISFPPSDDALYIVNDGNSSLPEKHEDFANPGSNFHHHGKKDQLFGTWPAKGTPIIWKRPTDFFKERFHLFGPRGSEDKEIRPDDVRQGQLGDCWLMSSLASLSEYPRLVKHLFSNEHEANAEGIYRIRLCKSGQWVDITLDDYFPCTVNGGPIYSKAALDELWVILMEKAFAKMNGSYSAIREGRPYEAMIDLTGAPFREIRFADLKVKEKIQNGELFASLVHYTAEGFLMSLSSTGVDHASESGHRGKEVGIVPGHAYSLLQAKTLSNGVQLCQVRNPWGNGEWGGDWSDKSKKWTEQFKHEVNFVDADDGSFWMAFEDVLKHFICINVCMSFNPAVTSTCWNEQRKKFAFQFDHSDAYGLVTTMYKLTVHENGSNFFVSVHQDDKRIVGAPDYIDFGVTVLRELGNDQFEFVGGTGNSPERQLQLEIKNLRAGEYLVVPTSSGCKMKQFVSDGVITEDDRLRNASLVVHSLKHYDLVETTHNAKAQRDAMDFPTEFNGEKKDIFNDGSAFLYVLRAGYNGRSYAVKNEHGHYPLIATLDFTQGKNLVSHRGDLKYSVTVNPGDIQTIHHIMPLNESTPGFTLTMSKTFVWKKK